MSQKVIHVQSVATGNIACISDKIRTDCTCQIGNRSLWSRIAFLNVVHIFDYRDTIWVISNRSYRMNHTSAVENNFLWVQILLWNKDDHHHENPETLESILLLYFFCLFCFLFSYRPSCPEYYRFLVLEGQVVQKDDSRYLDRTLVPGLDHRQNWNSYSLLPKDHNFQSSVELMSPVYHDNIEEYMENRLWPGFHGPVDGNTVSFLTLSCNVISIISIGIIPPTTIVHIILAPDLAIGWIYAWSINWKSV